VANFWKQQVNYGRAEADLERKWPGKYNALGHAIWEGRLYCKGLSTFLEGRRRIYHGVWGEALFQRVYHLPPTFLSSLPMMPEWNASMIGLTAAVLVGLAWRPLLLISLPILVLCQIFALQQAARHVTRTVIPGLGSKPLSTRLRLRLLLAFLYRIQPLARFVGRYTHGLVPWRLRGVSGFVVPWRRLVDVPMKRWRVAGDWLGDLQNKLSAGGATVMRGGDFDGWDLQLRGGLLGGVQLRLMAEDLEYGCQLLRFRVTPRFGRFALILMAAFSLLGAFARFGREPTLAATFGMIALLVTLTAVRECGAATATFLRTLHQLG
jgi:hypothetical protein